MSRGKGREEVERGSRLKGKGKIREREREREMMKLSRKRSDTHASLTHFVTSKRLIRC